ncbi:MAG: chorismate--pyruvate lyase family protein [Bacillota bacterium]
MNSALQSSALGIWEPVESWSAGARPAVLWPFISEIGSLTERLRAKAGRGFHVQLLKHGPVALDPGEASLLGVTPDGAGYQRQVYLCGREPWVYARSVTSGAGEKWLKDLGMTPLGEKVFAERDTRRGPIIAGQIGPEDPLYREAVAGLAYEYTQPLWARRSLLTVNGAGILIYECFLPGLAR